MLVKNVVFADHAATTPLKQEVLDEMMPYFIEKFGNASSIYSLGRESKDAVDKAREKVARALGATSREIFFTSGGTEADNWAIKGIAFANRDKGNHIITTSFEHHAVLHTCQYLEQEGFRVTYLPVGKDGIVSIDDVKDAITDKTILISVMFANNEVGTIQPIKEIGKIAKDHGIIFHTDAVQAIGNINIDVNDLNIDMLSLSAHKFNGPKGIGALYVRKGVKISSLLTGGAQEKGKRSGTENVPGIVGLGKAIEVSYSGLQNKNAKIKSLRDRLISLVHKRIPNAVLNGDKDKRLPGNANFSFPNATASAVLMYLDMEGICVSAGSACTAGSLETSHVLLSMGIPKVVADCSIRITLGEENNEDDVEKIADALAKAVEQAGRTIPLFNETESDKQLV